MNVNLHYILLCCSAWSVCAVLWSSFLWSKIILQKEPLTVGSGRVGLRNIGNTVSVDAAANSWNNVSISPDMPKSFHITMLTSLLHFVFNQCFLNAVVQCLSHTRGLRDYCLVKAYKHEKFSKEDAKLMEGVFLSPFNVNSCTQCFFPLL